MPPDPIHKCEWCSEPLDEAGECPNEMCESNTPEPEDDGGQWERDWIDAE